jgi:hypothetical protein
MTSMPACCSSVAALLDRVDAGARERIAVGARGDVGPAARVQQREELVQQHGAADAVDVVVAVDQDRLVGAQRLLDALHGLLHVLEQERVVQRGEVGPQEPAHAVRVVVATRDQHADDEVRQTQRVGERTLARIGLWRLRCGALHAL